MQHDGYIARIEFDDEADVFHGEVLNLKDTITFQGKSVRELKAAFADSVTDYLEFCMERGEEPEKPFSGKFVLRIPPELHRELALAAAREQKSLNSWASEVLERAVKT